MPIRRKPLRAINPRRPAPNSTSGPFDPIGLTAAGPDFTWSKARSICSSSWSDMRSATCRFQGISFRTAMAGPVKPSVKQPGIGANRELWDSPRAWNGVAHRLPELGLVAAKKETVIRRRTAVKLRIRGTRDRQRHLPQVVTEVID